MRKLMVLLIVGCLASSAMATWSDDFSSYPGSWDPIPSPWVVGDLTALYVQSNFGYGGGYGVGGPNLGVDARQWRATDGDTVTQVYGKVIANQGEIGDATAGIYLCGAADKHTDNVSLRLMGDGSTLRLEAEDWNGEAWWGNDRVTTTTGLLPDTWYDIRMTMVGTHATGEYKLASSTTWITAFGGAGVDVYADFDDTYVGIRADMGGRMDDVGAEPNCLTVSSQQW